MMQEDGDLFIATCDDGFFKLVERLRLDPAEIFVINHRVDAEQAPFVIFKRVYIIAAALFTGYIVQVLFVVVVAWEKIER